MTKVSVATRLCFTEIDQLLHRRNKAVVLRVQRSWLHKKSIIRTHPHGIQICSVLKERLHDIKLAILSGTMNSAIPKLEYQKNRTGLRIEMMHSQDEQWVGWFHCRISYRQKQLRITVRAEIRHFASEIVPTIIRLCGRVLQCSLSWRHGRAQSASAPELTPRFSLHAQIGFPMFMDTTSDEVFLRMHLKDHLHDGEQHEWWLTIHNEISGVNIFGVKNIAIFLWEVESLLSSRKRSKGTLWRRTATKWYGLSIAPSNLSPFHTIFDYLCDRWSKIDTQYRTGGQMKTFLTSCCFSVIVIPNPQYTQIWHDTSVKVQWAKSEKESYEKWVKIQRKSKFHQRVWVG